MTERFLFRNYAVRLTVENYAASCFLSLRRHGRTCLQKIAIACFNSQCENTRSLDMTIIIIVGCFK